MTLLECFYILCLIAGVGSVTFELFYIRFLHRTLDASLSREKSLLGILDESLKRCDELAEMSSRYQNIAENKYRSFDENSAPRSQSAS